MALRAGAIREARDQREGGRQDPRLDWWRAAKFGMFIHWGLYASPAGVWRGAAVPGIGEWIMLRARIPVPEYESLARSFNPVRFDAAEWVSLAKMAGQKYIVITSKHHDGFCMYHSRVTGYNIVDATPFGRDPLKELAVECERQGVRLGFYYSQTQDWHHPNGDGNDWDYDEQSKDFAGYLEGYVKPQVRELLTGYGPVAVMWFDTPKHISADQSRSLVDLCHRIQPECLVCGRIGNGLGDYASANDNAIPTRAVEVDWETPATINDTWGFKKDDQNWKPSSDMIRKLVDITSKGGNYLLNIGPTAEGAVPQPSVERLQTMGAWLKRNGEAIYGTRPGPVQDLDWCRSTARPGKLFLHVFDWPDDGIVAIPSFGCEVAGARLLVEGQDHPLSVRSDGEGVYITGLHGVPDAVDTVVVLDLPT
jgi:alpha-L-fucosidase